VEPGDGKMIKGTVDLQENKKRSQYGNIRIVSVANYTPLILAYLPGLKTRESDPGCH
jgi:hypothetical protein